MGRPSARDDLLRDGRQVLLEKGYQATGIADITAAAGVPKGSFYNHFPSKEAFGEIALQDYFDGLLPVFTECLQDGSRPMLQRLALLTDRLIEGIVEGAFAGCLVGTFAADAAPNSEPLRLAVERLFQRWLGLMAGAMAEGQRDGSITRAIAPEDAAGWFVSAWEGAVLRAKASRDAAPLHEFRRSLLGLLRAGP